MGLMTESEIGKESTVSKQFFFPILAKSHRPFGISRLVVDFLVLLPRIISNDLVY